MGIADKDYFLDADGNLAQGEDDAATLLIRKGQEIPKDMAERYFGKVAQSDEEKAAAPAENKAKTPAKNKGAK